MPAWSNLKTNCGVQLGIASDLDNIGAPSRSLTAKPTAELEKFAFVDFDSL
jgi:hypothetical protein